MQRPFLSHLMPRRAWLTVLLVLVASLALSACGQTQSVSEGQLPTLAPTDTAAPHTTPTPVPATQIDDPPSVDWTEVAHFAPAMRPEYVDEIDPWVNGQRYYVVADLELTETAAVVRGAQRVRYVNTSQDTLDEVAFRLYANLPSYGGRMRITEAQVAGQPVEIEVLERNTSALVPLTEPLAPEDSVEIVLHFVLVAERGMTGSRYAHFGFQNDVLSAPEWFPLIAPYDEEDGWFIARNAGPSGDKVYSETALIEVLLTHPDDLVIAISGVTIEDTDNGDGTLTRRVVTGPMRDSMLIASPVLGKLTENVQGTDVNVYYWPGDERGAEFAMEISVASLEIFNREFGDYPYSELDVVETFTISGVEFPGVIIINDNNWFAGNQGLEITIAHEVAHQWWYGVVGNDQVGAGWIDESLTSYSEGIYLRNHYESEERYQNWIQGNRAGYNNYRSQPQNNDPIMNQPVTAYRNSGEWGVAHYTKGRVLYNTLEESIGREAFRAALRAYYQDMKYKVSQPIDLVRHFEDASGLDLHAFFYSWVGNFDGLDPEAKAEVDAERQPADTRAS